MADGLCKIHGTELNGFGSFSFCNECEAENDIQNKYEEDKESSFAAEIYEDEKDSLNSPTNTWHGCIGGLHKVNIPYQQGVLVVGRVGDDLLDAWIVRGQQAPCQQKGLLDLAAGELVYMKQPYYYAMMGAIYRISLDDAEVITHMIDVHRVLNNCTVHAEQLIHFNDRVLIGGVDYGPVP